MATKNAVGNSLTGSTGSGAFVGATSPTLVTPLLGTPTSGTLTNCTGLPPAGVIGMKPLVQMVYTQTGTVATGTTQIPGDNTIPQNTEGTEFMTRSITPTNSSNILEIEVVAICASSAIVSIGVALFQDSTANALAAAFNLCGTVHGSLVTTFKYYMVAGTTSSTTFKVRIGGNAASTISFNGQNAAQIYGGVMASSITVKEWTV